MAARIRKGDQVVVTTGSSRGVRGEVLSVLPGDNKAVVRGAAVAKRHTRPNRMGEQGGIIEKEMPIHLSNLKLVDPKSGKPTRVGFRVLEDGRKVRVAKATGEVIEG
ncbi:50S ribosomal protein L24 [Gluconacetobacter sp. 1b LMG 1731]|uniref:Large ribosomal subunit protein uL24 n=2 Tax=Gluconacetobacter TaxID=89583 RepID=A0A7W4IJV4_9PROT|nr:MULTISPECIES: 50S ribosomal protein L24 [Gluconacetobacter]GBR01126.1 50S ribosomal protein L24 [Gluconacetobacter liquefaciens NRIC 0522]MBB2164214.1 50S ribosomal protein L24 [Gluconacetobacter dulcium]MBB2186844.1 50S ribosomal protein L24 [Gluconacetobacter liquefaciens]MBB2193378.1 50S ribosomal protein L24 [Gluconacetobacter dulcium]MBB2196173.1 50S ribosomal protein L24 [Gluconacetobacter dulcium]